MLTLRAASDSTIDRRGRLAAGSIINGRVWTGTPVEPSLTQRVDEFTVRLLTGGVLTTPGEHTSTFNSGPAPATLESFAFYYDIIRILGLTPPTPGAGGEQTPADRLFDDLQRELEAKYTGFNATQLYYQGFTQYGPRGEAIYQYISSRLIEASGGTLDPEMEDVLRRLRERLAAIQAEAGSGTVESETPNDSDNVTDEETAIPSPPPVASVE